MKDDDIRDDHWEDLFTYENEYRQGLIGEMADAWHYNTPLIHNPARVNIALLALFVLVWMIIIGALVVSLYDRNPLHVIGFDPTECHW